MENVIDKKIDCLLCFELILKNIIKIDYPTVFALSLTNKKLNEIVYQTAKQREKYLSSYITIQLGLLKTEAHCMAYHPLGTACTFLTVTDKELSKKQFKCDLNLCRADLNGDKKSIAIYTHRLMGIIAESFGKKIINEEIINTVRGYRRPGHWWYPRALDGPAFDKNENASITIYSLNYHYERDNFREKSFFIDQDGTLRVDHHYQKTFAFSQEKQLKFFKNTYSVYKPQISFLH
jgi:hypothetical protein